MKPVEDGEVKEILRSLRVSWDGFGKTVLKESPAADLIESQQATITKLTAKLKQRDFQDEVLEETGRLLDESQATILKLRAKVEELTECNGISIGLKCPACDDVGWYVAFNGEQEQCEFCYTCPDSIFNRKAALTGE